MEPAVLKDAVRLACHAPSLYNSQPWLWVFIVVEDHYPQGGLGSAVLEALADTPHRPRVVQLAVSGVPGSGSPAEVMDADGITAPHIVAAAKRVLNAS